MDKINKALKRLWQDESGQGAMEYILILVVVGTIVFVFKDKIVGIIAGKNHRYGHCVGKALWVDWDPDPTRQGEDSSIAVKAGAAFKLSCGIWLKQVCKF